MKQVSQAPTYTKEAFQSWCKIHKPLAYTVCKAQAFAEVERERVNQNGIVSEGEPVLHRPQETRV